MIQDSGNRREFGTGAVRDIAEGKGRLDLMPLFEVSCILPSEQGDIISLIDTYVQNGDSSLQEAIELFSVRQFGSIPNAILEVAKHMEEGCKKYGENNWRKGIPTHCYIDSGTRHYLKFLRGDNDERHDRAFLWNMMCCLWTVRNLPEMNDLYFAKGGWGD